jgi:hypothetical protein
MIHDTEGATPYRSATILKDTAMTMMLLTLSVLIGAKLGTIVCAMLRNCGVSL